MTDTGPEADAPNPGQQHPGQPLARRIVRAGVVTFCVVQPTLMFGAGLPMIDTLLLALLLVLVPAFSLAQVPLLAGAVIQRLPAYWASIATLWLLGTACWFVGTRSGGPAAVGLVGLPPLSMASWSLALTGAGLLVIVVFRQIAAVLGTHDTPLLRELLPRTPGERRVFALLSLAAGSGEEMAYRGYVIPVLAPLLGGLGAAALSTAVFGVLHAYQGWLGVLRTGLMGAVLAGGFLASGSLWPPILAHVLIDLLAGIGLGERLLSPSADSGVAAEHTTVPPA